MFGFKSKVICFLISSFIIFSNLFSDNHKPQLILHFDVNRTLFMLDPASDKTLSDCIIHTLADKYEDRWDKRVLKPVSYTDYIKEYVYPGMEAGNVALKKVRKEKISQFINDLAKTQHPLAQQVRQEYDVALSKLEKQSTLILTAFYRLLDHLDEQHYNYSIVLRTFGGDLDEVIEDIENQTSHDFFYARAEFKEGVLRFEHPSDLKEIKDLGEFYSFLKQHPHIAIHDDWLPWNRSGESQEFGKTFPVDMQDDNVVSIFFDDNVVSKEGSFKNIVNPRDVRTGKPLSVHELIGKNRIYAVNTMEAILDETYFIRLVEAAVHKKIAK